MCWFVLRCYPLYGGEGLWLTQHTHITVHLSLIILWWRERAHHSAAPKRYFVIANNTDRWFCLLHWCCFAFTSTVVVVKINATSNPLRCQSPPDVQTLCHVLGRRKYSVVHVPMLTMYALIRASRFDLSLHLYSAFATCLQRLSRKVFCSTATLRWHSPRKTSCLMIASYGPSWLRQTCRHCFSVVGHRALCWQC
jgi:hypothetical protein